MRLSVLFVLAVTISAPAVAQTSPTIGPSFVEKAVNTQNFDAAFNVKVTMVPAVNLLLGQSPDARFDAVVCNADNSGVGWVRVNPTARWGVLEAGNCTMFSNFTQLHLAPVDADHLWTARVYLRARK